MQIGKSQEYQNGDLEVKRKYQTSKPYPTGRVILLLVPWASMKHHASDLAEDPS
jgi:hypothetical protein